MNIDLNNPETWNRPGWEANSCYANVALWALLYNNVYIDLISGTELIPNSDFNVIDSESEIKENLLYFHDAINYDRHINSKDVYNFTKNIRQEISYLTNNDDWKTQFMDPADFLIEVSEIFKNINNCNIENNLLPLIRLGDLDINASGKTVTFKMYDEAKSCDFNRHNGLIVQYGDRRDANLEEKYYSIGKYKLYAFLHWVGGGHYSCYFEFNNEWYNFDDYENMHQGRIIKVQRVKRTTIYNDSFIFFYKFDETILTDINVTLTEYFSRDDRRLSIVEPRVNPKASSVRSTTQLPLKEVTTYNLQPQIETKNWLEIFNRCNDIKEELEPQNPSVVVTSEGTEIVTPPSETQYKTIEDVETAIEKLNKNYDKTISILYRKYYTKIINNTDTNISFEKKQEAQKEYDEITERMKNQYEKKLSELNTIKDKLKTETPQPESSISQSVTPPSETQYKTIEDVETAIENVEEEYQSEIRRLNEEYDEEKHKYQSASGVDEMEKKNV